MGKGCKILHEDCDPSLAQDRSLPYTAFIVEYLQDSSFLTFVPGFGLASDETVMRLKTE